LLKETHGWIGIPIVSEQPILLRLGSKGVFCRKQNLLHLPEDL